MFLHRFCSGVCSQAGLKKNCAKTGIFVEILCENKHTVVI